MVKVVVGMMGSSVSKGSAAMASPAQVTTFLQAVKAHGVKEIDTARVYNGGRSEELLGEAAITRHFAVSTKAPGFAPGSLKEQAIRDNYAKSAAALTPNQIDIYYFHGPDRATSLEEQCRAVGKLHQEGRFDRFGVSNLSDQEVRSIYDICKREGYCLPSVYQGGYSPLHRAAEKTLLPLLRRLGMVFYAFSPLAGGLLAKPVEQILKPQKDSRFEAMPVFGDLFLNETILSALKQQTELGEKNGMGIMESTLRWLMHHAPLKPEDGVILGASTTPQIEASLAATEKGPLPNEVAQGWETLWKTVEKHSPGYQG